MSKTFDKQTASFLAKMAENTPRVNSDDMQYWIDNPKELQRLLSGLSREYVSIPLLKMENAWLSENAKKVFSGSLGAACKTKSENLTERLNDDKIIEEYGEEIIFESVSDLHATISNFVAKQPEGQKGELLNNGHANIFYVRVNDQVHYVNVSWDVDKWYVYSFPIDSIQWNVGLRVFCNC